MRPQSIATIAYAPGDPPANPAQLQAFLRAEFAKIAAVVQALAAGHLDMTTAEPAKPRDGDLRYADGAGWDPGSGKGLYVHNGSVWVLVIAL